MSGAKCLHVIGKTEDERQLVLCGQPRPCELHPEEITQVQAAQLRGYNRAPVVYQTDNGMKPPETWTLTLNRYQRDNLLGFINAALFQDERPVKFWNNGDWIGELKWMLGKSFYNTETDEYVKRYDLDKWDSPNFVRELPA